MMVGAVAANPTVANSQMAEPSPRNGNGKFIYSNNMTLGLAIGSKSTWKDENQSQRVLRKAQSTADVLEKVLPTIPPWVLVDAIGINKPLPSADPSPTSPPSPIRPPLSATSRIAPWTFQSVPPPHSVSSQSPSSPSSSTHSHPLSAAHTRAASSSCEHLSKFVDVVRNGARSTKRLQGALRSISGKAKAKANTLPEPEFEIITPGSSWKALSAASRSLSSSDLPREKENVLMGMVPEKIVVVNKKERGERDREELWDDLDDGSVDDEVSTDGDGGDDSEDSVDVLSPIRGPIDPYAYVPPARRQRRQSQQQQRSPVYFRPRVGEKVRNESTHSLTVVVSPETQVTPVLSLDATKEGVSPLSIVTATSAAQMGEVKRLRPLPSPPTVTAAAPSRKTTTNALASSSSNIKHRPPGLVLTSPPVRSSSRSPMLLSASFTNVPLTSISASVSATTPTSTYRDRELPPVPPWSSSMSSPT
ncbi:hypothetical protein D9757_001021 [Collybiopsis confluens]|uniref:Uncharacterized protein n=1 Tax=Collybiopsis confluens TaxID=2823264 RepID=A0A8H5I0J0_9AGAR|nr:hypothetical protein D9757_001021 [Collybiopsis confluens]